MCSAVSGMSMAAPTARPTPKSLGRNVKTSRSPSQSHCRSGPWVTPRPMQNTTGSARSRRAGDGCECNRRKWGVVERTGMGQTHHRSGRSTEAEMEDHLCRPKQADGVVPEEPLQSHVVVHVSVCRMASGGQQHGDEQPIAEENRNTKEQNGWQEEEQRRHHASSLRRLAQNAASLRTMHTQRQGNQPPSRYDRRHPLACKTALSELMVAHARRT